LGFPASKVEAGAELLLKDRFLMFSYSDVERRSTSAQEHKPEFFRLPKSGERDPHFGLPRTKYYELEKAGTIRLVRLRKRGNTRGTTLIPFDQVLVYLRGLETEAK
jgi:hypothetical protein